MTIFKFTKKWPVYWGFFEVPGRGSENMAPETYFPAIISSRGILRKLRKNAIFGLVGVEDYL